MLDSSLDGAPLKAVDSLQRYLALPIGSCLFGPTYAVWWRSVGLNGIVFWDRPDQDDVYRITRALDAELAPDVEPHASLIDARRVRAVDLGAFNALSEYVHRRKATFSRVVLRQALVRPEGLAGAAVAGFYAVLAPAFPVRVFTDPNLALRWLQVEQVERVVAELDGLFEKATASSSLVVALRAHLDRHLGVTTVAEAALALGLSARQLQRKLHDEHTCFQREETTAKIRAAKVLLLETSYDVKRIAVEVGCASVPHFCTLFRKEVSETPSQWRARQRPDVMDHQETRMEV